MDVPICIIDAYTFVNHIHEIKGWVYSGYLRLVVPTSVYENVTQLHQKSVEVKPTVQEESRARSLGRTRKEYPAFDINPKLAKECLDRIRARKDGEKDAMNRPPCEEEERLEAISFQGEAEEYSPWKDIPIEEEKEKAAEDRPLSWAELARKKQNQGNGVAEKGQGPKGPVKPKLVSKAVNDNASPWKIQRNAPSIPVAEVPGPMRGSMSHALWRLHESIDRNDSNQLFLLSDDERINKVAMKLNITTRSMKDVREKCQARVKKVDLNVTGALELDGLAKPAIIRNSEVESQAQPSLMNDGANTSGENSYLKVERSTAETGGYTELRLQDHAHEAEKPEVESFVLTNTESRQGGSVPLAIPEQDGEVDVETTRENAAVASANAPPQTIESTVVDSALKTESSTLGKLTDMVVDPAPASIRGSCTNDALEDTLGLAVGNGRQVEESEDSDEEIVVFKPNPKRMSAHKKAAQANSRPTTANESLQPSPMDSSPKVSKSTKTPVQKAHAPKHLNVVDTREPKTSSPGPTIIDPDAFGRGFAVKPDTHPHDSIRHPRSRHSPHASMQHTQPNSATKVDNNSGERYIKTSPARNAPSRSPRPPPRIPRSTPTNARLTDIPVISHQAYTRAPLVAPNSHAPRQSDPNAIGNIAMPTHSASTQASRNLSIDHNAAPQQFGRSNVQRIAHATSRAYSADAPRRDTQDSGLPAAPTNGSIQAQPQRNVKPTLFEPELDHTRAPPQADIEPKTAMPDVNYVLKSGTPRAATRGKGKLWVG